MSIFLNEIHTELNMATRGNRGIYCIEAIKDLADLVNGVGPSFGPLF